MNPREYNSILAAVAASAGEVATEDDGARKSGKTFRSILRTLLWASANPHKRALYATMSVDARNHAFKMATKMVEKMGFTVRPDKYQIELPNGSVIEFRCAIDTGYLAGRKFAGVVRDVDGR